MLRHVLRYRAANPSCSTTDIASRFRYIPESRVCQNSLILGALDIRYGFDAPFRSLKRYAINVFEPVATEVFRGAT